MDYSRHVPPQVIADLLAANTAAAAAAWHAHRGDVVAIRARGTTLLTTAATEYAAYRRYRPRAVSAAVWAGGLGGIAAGATLADVGTPWTYAVAPAVAWCTIRAIRDGLRADAAMRRCQSAVNDAAAWLSQITQGGVTGTPDG